jgi:hypothetical protein
MPLLFCNTLLGFWQDVEVMSIQEYIEVPKADLGNKSRGDTRENKVHK